MLLSTQGLPFVLLSVQILLSIPTTVAYTRSNTKVEIYKKQCKGDTHIFDITEAYVKCLYGSCRWGSHGTLITTYQFGDLFPTAAPTEHPTRYPSPEPSKRKKHIFWLGLPFDMFMLSYILIPFNSSQDQLATRRPLLPCIQHLLQVSVQQMQQLHRLQMQQYVNVCFHTFVFSTT